MKKHLSMGILCLGILCSARAAADFPYVFLAHPVGLMHGLQTGQAPGWSATHWFKVSESLSQIWGAPLTMRNKTTLKDLTYESDYEQMLTVANFGLQLHEDWALQVFLPYSSRGGGVFDPTIDRFHIVTGSTRFRRQEYPEGRNRFEVGEDGTSRFTNSKSAGFSNVNFQLRYWPIKIGDPKKCPCGLGFTLDFKLPLASANTGLSSGSFDYSFYTHIGAPLGELGGLYFTGGINRFEKNYAFASWPRKETLTFWDLSLDIGLSERWSLLIMFRAQSPLMDVDQLEYIDPELDNYNRILNRMATGHNALVHWRVNESIGVEYRHDERNHFHLIFSEDLSLGRPDDVGVLSYVNHAPDIMATFQYSLWY
ncbi:MAG: hypothetical protein IT289_11335 [Oligoflexia bacterium]|nr:hypothetical protein [Oligoflexia bacterium]